MSGPRNEIFRALLALGAGASWGNEPDDQMRTASRKFQHYGKVNQEEMPALFQTEPTEGDAQRTGLEPMRTFRAMWTVYFRTDPDSPSDLGQDRMNDIVDALEARVLALEEPEGRQTLGGRVYTCRIEGEVIKISGDDDGLGMVVVPILMLVP